MRPLMAIEIPTRPDQLPTTAPRFVGKAVKRIEDPALVSGTVEFIDNLSLPGMLHCAILRSPHPHARIVSIDTTAALSLEGVEAVLTGDDVARWCAPGITAPEGWGNYCMAVGKVRFVGEPVVAVAAASRYIAEDALELVQVEYELLPPVANPDEAMAPGAPLVFEDRGTNVIQSRSYTWGDIDRVFAEADRVVSRKFRWNRVGANPTETFGCICQWDLADNSLTCRGAYQTPRFMALGRAASLKLPANKVKVISHAQGGGFGGKGGPRGTDIAALLSRKTNGRPVKYIEDRIEYLLAGGGQSWDRYYEAALAVKADGTVTGFRVRLVDDQGAGAEGYGTISAAKPLAAFTGNYRIEAAFYDMTLVATNRAPTYPYRGYGPPPHNLVLESLMDIAARELAVDPAELRRRNYIRPEQFPYTVPSGNEYDSGNYAAVHDRVLEMADYQALRKAQAKARAEGRLVGIGVVSTVEPGVFDWNAYATVGVPGVGVPEGVKVAVDILGNVTVAVGFNLQGQGQFTVAAQVVADYLGVDMNSVRVATASTDVAMPHFGQGGSRLGVAVSGAILGACDKLRQTFSRVVAHLMHAEPEQVELIDGRLQLKHAPEHGMSVAEVAGVMLARSDLLPPGVEPCPEATYVWTAPNRNLPDDQGRCRSYLTAANATHVVQVEIDRDTGQVTIPAYFIVDDCGTRLNPASVEGQLQGGVAQGVGAALYEEYVYDAQCQPLVSTFVDYLVPTIHEVPMTTKDHLVTPSPVAPLGAKGCGEGAIHTTPAALLCAINDALSPLGREILETPASPHRLWKVLHGPCA
ncbi:xanthine dehydrogenase family protein molybdopterin-binding subunit [Aromatoleum diolicum]|uniref:Molybdopterin-dependent oxidoreductase n=1 Tax=Aromatoleum diolicum TaxID=75796 RepID=A0ABX1QG65_9RHOO|nr:xanthine dehydrogenase family protein molybdopterin-binding subunit [Aromatoleum diolicum]NMG76505.1 molybdopterin-dependent oxidoreductase [Aromatoleum diolicum]